MATVIWNQLAAPFEYNVWEPYNSSKASVTFSSRIATVTYLVATYGDGSSIRQTSNNVFSSNIGELFYISVMMNPSFDASFYMELSGTTDRDKRVSVSANTWARYSKVAVPTTDRNRTDARAYIGIFNSTSANDTAQFKSPIIISLTKMYGAGNEPTAAEFERQCALNGIDLTKYQPRDTGTPRHWITTENKRLQTARSGNTVDSEDIAHFVTNCAMPLRSCKVEIEPSLEGYNSIELDYRGRNLLISIAPPAGNIFVLNSDGSLTANGTISGSSWFDWNTSVSYTTTSTTQYVQTRLLPNGKYFIAVGDYVDANHQSNNYPRYSLDKSNYDGTNTRQGAHASTDSEGCIIVDDTYKYNWMRIYQSSGNTYSNYTIYPQTYLASEPNRTWEPCNWRKFTVNFDNKIYGGTLDLVSGKLTTEWVKQTFDGTETWEAEGTKLYRTWISGLATTDKDDTSSIVSSYLSSVTRTALYPGTATDGICLMNGDRVLVRMQSQVSTLGEWTTYIANNPMQVIYKMATPITYQLTPQEITTLLGVNNVWCNDGKVTLQYYANSPTQDSTDMFERRRLAFVANSPHLQHAESGNTGYCDTIARFETNLTLPLKEATVTLSPIQGGSGDPSSTNVRAISGVDSIQVIKAGVNLLECDTFSSGLGSGNITYNGVRNDDGQIESISASGTTTQANAFYNLNYKSGRQSLMTGQFAFHSYSPQYHILPTSSARMFYDIETNKRHTTYTEEKWRQYNIVQEGTYTLARLQVCPYQSGVTVDTTVYPMMCLPQDEGCDFEPFKGIKYNISLSELVYGGTIDLINGILTVTHKSFQINENTTVNGANGNVIWITPPYELYHKSNMNTTDGCCCNIIPTYSGTGDTNYSARFGYIEDKFYNLIYVYGLADKYSEVTNVASAKTFLINNNAQFVYKLQNPIIYSIDPIVLRTFRGVNNIWSDNGVMNIKYWAI